MITERDAAGRHSHVPFAPDRLFVAVAVGGVVLVSRRMFQFWGAAARSTALGAGRWLPGVVDIRWGALLGGWLGLQRLMAATAPGQRHLRAGLQRGWWHATWRAWPRLRAAHLPAPGLGRWAARLMHHARAAPLM